LVDFCNDEHCAPKNSEIILRNKCAGELFEALPDSYKLLRQKSVDNKKESAYHEYLNLSNDTVYRRIDRYAIPVHRMGRFWKFRR
jgi:hypothetical protein